MSLTNDQIMAKNFQDFYAQIRPYLNGQVPPVFNKFSKSDLYSTDERIVGQWIDGKPLYQKYISLQQATIDTTGGNWITISSLLSGFNAEAIIKSYAKQSLFNIYYPVAGQVNNTNDLLIMHFRNSSISFDAVIIQYTKTTDSPVEIGNDTDYSTTEKIVGTWIDGKPLYQKTVHIDSVTCETTNLSKYVELLNDSTAVLRNSCGEFNLVQDTTFLNRYMIDSFGFNDAGSTHIIKTSVIQDGSTKKVRLKINQALSSTATVKLEDVNVTLQYTKTTD